MKHMSIIDKINQQQIPLFTFVIFVIFTISIVAFLVGLLIYYYKKFKDLKRIKFGFGGKPIFSVLIFLLIAVAIPLTYMASKETADIVRRARAEKEVKVTVNEIKKEKDKILVSFIAVPYIDDESWVGRDYDILWEVEGVKSFNKLETKVNKKNPSYFTKLLPSGDYKVRVEVTGEDFKVVENIEFSI